MRRRAPFVALVVLAVGAPAARAQPKEPAELLPASSPARYTASGATSSGSSRRPISVSDRSCSSNDTPRRRAS